MVRLINDGVIDAWALPESKAGTDEVDRIRDYVAKFGCAVVAATTSRATLRRMANQNERDAPRKPASGGVMLLLAGWLKERMSPKIDQRAAPSSYSRCSLSY